MEADTSQIISAVGAIVAAIGSAIAAIAASKSARTAHDSTQLAIQSESRELRRELSTAAAEVVSEAQQVNALINELKIEYTTLFNFTGGGSHSSEILIRKALDERLADIEPIRMHASKFVTEFKNLKDASKEDIAEKLSQIHSYMFQVKNHKLDLERDLKQVTQQNRDYRERMLNK